MFHQLPHPRYWLSLLTTNPLVRKCDRIEFGLHAAAVLLAIAAIPICLAVTSAVHGDVAASRYSELASRTQVTATLLAPPSKSTGTAPARWTSPGPGHPEITGLITPTSPLNSTTSPIWVDRTTGQATSSPLDQSTVWVRTINTGIAVFVITLWAAASAWGFTTAWFTRQRSQTWDAEWRRCAALEPTAFITWTQATHLGKD